ncbi:MAG: class I SAM-dependent rRNA methyltransferase [Planctomycetota bacterium]
MPLPSVQLQVRVRGRHPWFFRKMVRKPETPIPAGSVVHVRDKDRRLIGSGFYNPRTDLALRLFSGIAIEDPQAHFRRAFEAAIALREETLQLQEITNAYRLVHSEGDGFPGLILDRLGDAFVAQVNVLGTFLQMEQLGELLRERHPRCKLVMLQDEEMAQREGMERIGTPTPVNVEVKEHGLRYAVQAGGGHKTGFFADQRDNRKLVRELAHGRSVLDLCCNSGGFAMNAVAGGAKSVHAADLDEEMVEQTKVNAARNGLTMKVEHADAFDLLRDLRHGAHDLIVLDPPKWVKSRDEMEQGLARYRDLNRLALEKVRPGGMIVTCSCSGSVDENVFLRMLDEASAQAGRGTRVLMMRGAGPDHPMALDCPQTRYLKVALLQVRE